MLRLKLSHVSKRGPRSLSPDFDHLTQEKRVDLTYVMLLFYHIILSIMSITITTMASLITSLTVVYSTIYSGADQRKHQSSASLAFVRGIHRGLPAQMASNAENVFDDVIMPYHNYTQWDSHVFRTNNRIFAEYFFPSLLWNIHTGLGPEYLVLVLVVLEYLISVLVLVLVLRPLGT